MSNLFDPHYPSPTSRLGINLRYFHIEQDKLGLSADIDLGKEVEAMAEDLYGGYVGPDGLLGFEQMTRAAIGESLAMDVTLCPLAIIIGTLSHNQTLIDEAGKYRIRTSLEMSRTIQGLLKAAGVGQDQMSLLRKFL